MKMFGSIDHKTTGEKKGIGHMRRSLGLCLALLALVSGQVWSQQCAVTVDGNDQIQFVQKELSVDSSCAEITITLKHIGTLAANVMGHNWVLTKTADYMAVAQAGQGAGPQNEYVPPGDERVLAATKIIGGGEETTITFDGSILESGGDYTYFCSFPGHFVLMYGKLIVG